MPTEDPRIEGIAGVAFWTDDLETMIRFYGQTLGLPLHSRHGDFVAFEPRPGVRINVGTHTQVHGRARDPHRVMLHLSVRNIRALADRLKAEGVSFLREPQRESWGGWVATIQDPDGNILQLLELKGMSA